MKSIKLSNPHLVLLEQCLVMFIATKEFEGILEYVLVEELYERINWQEKIAKGKDLRLKFRQSELTAICRLMGQFQDHSKIGGLYLELDQLRINN